MANWIEGTLKVRGNKADLMNFIENGLNCYMFDFEAMKDVELERNEWLMIRTYDTCTEVNIIKEVHVESTHRAFVYGEGLYIEDSDDKNTLVLDVRQAWAFESVQWREVAKRWNIDIRLFGIECGMQFVQEIEVINGKLTLDKEYHYDDWMWECPFPRMGG